jgi:hypothetical protein
MINHLFLELKEPFSNLIISHQYLEQSNIADIVTEPNLIRLILKDSSAINIKFATEDDVVTQITGILCEEMPFP